MIKALFQRLDRWIDNTWRDFYAFVIYRFDSKKDEVDIDWLNMANDIKFNEKQMWEHRTKTYLQETESLEKWNEEINRET